MATGPAGPCRKYEQVSASRAATIPAAGSPPGRRGPALAGNWGDGWLFRADAGSVSGSADESLPPKAPTTRVNEMAKGKKKLEVIHLVCEETGDQNYTLRRKTGGEKLKVKKYSPRLRKHTLHLEKKK